MVTLRAATVTPKSDCSGSEQSRKRPVVSRWTVLVSGIFFLEHNDLELKCFDLDNVLLVTLPETPLLEHLAFKRDPVPEFQSDLEVYPYELASCTDIAIDDGTVEISTELTGRRHVCR